MKILNHIKNIPKSLKTASKIIFTFLLMFLIIKGFQNNLGEKENLLESLLINLKSIKPLFFCLAIIIYVLCTLMATFRIYLLTKVNDITLSFRYLFENYYIGLFFNAILMGATGGDLVRSWYLVKKTGKKTEVVTLVFLDRFIGMFVMLSIGITAILINLKDPELAKFLRPVLYLAIVSNIILVTGTLTLSSKRLVKKFSFTKPLLNFFKVNEIAKKIHLTLNLTRKYKKTIFLTALTTLIVQALAITSCWFATRAIPGIDPVPFRYFMLFLPIIFTVQAIPISLGGIGVGEFAFVQLFKYADIPESTSLTIAVLTRIILILMALAGGIVYLKSGHETIPDDIA